MSKHVETIGFRVERSEERTMPESPERKIQPLLDIPGDEQLEIAVAKASRVFHKYQARCKQVKSWCSTSTDGENRYSSPKTCSPCPPSYGWTGTVGLIKGSAARPSLKVTMRQGDHSLKHSSFFKVHARFRLLSLNITERLRRSMC